MVELQPRRKGGDGQRRQPRHRRGDRARVRRAGRDRDRLVAQAGGARRRRRVDPRPAGGIAHAIACHSGKADEIERFFARVEAEFGRLDVHVNNAAINPYFGPVIDTPLAAFDKTLEVDLRGYFLMTQAAARLMAKNGGGSIINIGSVSGIIPGVNEGTYAICKAGVIAMTRSFAKEMGKQHVRVNCIAPGPVETQFAGGAVRESRQPRPHAAPHPARLSRTARGHRRRRRLLRRPTPRATPPAPCSPSTAGSRREAAASTASHTARIRDARVTRALLAIAPRSTPPRSS